MSVVNDVHDYAHFRSIIELGFQIHHSEYCFEKIIVFSWIKEEVDRVRKN